mmetsp:Transcript_82417/g.197731  ORF Transcript_82417/g.197731 Transcript_82417/m.197731 type:complete len:234 (-) Transcript_82417:2-703(-)
MFLCAQALIDEDSLAVVLHAIRVSYIEPLGSHHDVVVSATAIRDSGLLHAVDLHRASLASVVANVSDVDVGLALLGAWADSDILPVVGPTVFNSKPRHMLSLTGEAIQLRPIAGVVVHPVDATIHATRCNSGTLVYLRCLHVPKAPASLRRGALMQDVRTILCIDQSSLWLGLHLHKDAASGPWASWTLAIRTGLCIGRHKKGDHKSPERKSKHLETPAFPGSSKEFDRDEMA